MNAGRGLEVVRAELARQQDARHDYTMPAKMLQCSPQGEGLRFWFAMSGATHQFTANDWAQGQVAEFCGIPWKYWQTMAEQRMWPLMAANVNRWLEMWGSSKRMVRTLDDSIRGFMSDRYRPLDNVDLLEAVVPVLPGGYRVESCEVTERRLYLKVVHPDLEFNLGRLRFNGAVDDIVQAGMVFSNSEVGAGAVWLRPLVWRKVCSNGLIVEDASMRQNHLGRGADYDSVRRLLSDATKTADDRAFWMKCRDVAKAAFTLEGFKTIIGRIREAREDVIDSDDLQAVVEVTCRKVGLGGGMVKPVLKNLSRAGELTRWGMVNAVTACANTHEDYEAATEIEKAGGAVLELPARDWTKIAEAEGSQN